MNTYLDQYYEAIETMAHYTLAGNLLLSDVYCMRAESLQNKLWGVR